MANQEKWSGSGKQLASGRDVNLFRDEADGSLVVRDAKNAKVLAKAADPSELEKDFALEVEAKAA